MKADKIKPTIVLSAICLVVAVLLSVINMVTAPIIEERRLAEANKALLVVMPEGKGFEELDISAFEGLSPAVIKIYKETSGKGFVFQMSVAGYQPGLVIMCGIDSEGTITGSKYLESNETYGLEKVLDNAYNGKTLADAELIIAAGASPKSATSKAYYEAITAALQANVIVSGGKLDDSIVLKNLIATVAPDYADLAELEAYGNIKSAYKSTNGAGYAYILSNGEVSCLVIVKANGEAKAYDVDGNDVTSANAALVDEAKAHTEIDKLSALLAVMPEGSALNSESVIYDFENASASVLKDVPASVTYIYKEANGLGYIIRTTAVSDYSVTPMQITIGIGADGKICGIQIDAYSDSIDFRNKDDKYMDSFIGKDSALADVGTVSGATYSSVAFKNAVAEAMETLIANDMISAGVKSDDQILTELIATVAPGYTKTEEIAVSGNIVKALKATNDTGFAYIMTEGGSSYLAVVNAMGVCKIYDVEGADVTAAHASLATEAKAHASANQKDYTDALKTKLEKMMVGAADITVITPDTFNTVVSAVSFTVEGETYYGFYARSIGFHQMDVYVVIDANGAIAKIDAKQFIFEEEYFMTFGGMNVSDYKNGFVGITGETWNGDEAVIATATMTSNAMKEATTDAFASFESIK